MTPYSWLICGQSRQPHSEDGPRAVLVLICTFLQSWLIIGLARGYGSYLPILMNEFKEGRDKIALVGSLADGLSFLITALVAWLNSFIDNRIVSGAGQLSLIIAFAASSAVGQVEVLYFTYGIFVAIGKSLTLTTHILVIIKYFKKNLSLAQGINIAGGALGIMTVPNILQYLLDSFGWRNAFRFQTAAVFLSSFLCLMYSPNVETKRNDSQDAIASLHMPDKNLGTRDKRASDVNSAVQFPLRKDLDDSSECNTDVERNKNEDGKEEVVEQLELRQNEKNEFKYSLHRKSRMGSNMDEGEYDELQGIEEIPKKEHSFEKHTTDREGKNVPVYDEKPTERRKFVCLKEMFGSSVWKVQMYTIAVISICLGSYVMFSVSVHLVKFSEDIAGISGTRATSLYTFLGIGSLIARIVTGTLCDIKYIKPSMVNMVAEVLGGINVFLLTLSTKYIHLAILIFVHGVADGMFRTTTIVLFTTSVERSKSSSALGQGYTAFGPFAIAGPAITGLIADAFDGYKEAYYLNGFILMAAAAVHLIPILLRFYKPSMANYIFKQAEASPCDDNSQAKGKGGDLQSSNANQGFNHN